METNYGTDLHSLVSQLSRRVAELETQMNDLRKADEARSIKATIDGGITVGVITHKSRAFFEDLARQPDGLRKIKEYIASQLVLEARQPTQSLMPTRLTDCEKRLCEQLGMTEEEYLKKIKRI